MALGEISRSLAPGGVFVGTTFLTAESPLEEVLGEGPVAPLGNLLRRLPAPEQAQFRWWTERELRDLCAAVGLVDFRRERKNRFILFSARKPGVGVVGKP